MTRPLRVLLSGGGSGGHVFPAFAVADAVRGLGNEQETEIVFRFAGTADGVESELAVEAGLTYATIAARALRGRNPLSQLLSLGATATGVLDALALIARFRPQVVFLTGGYVSAPVGVAAWLMRRPIVLLQPDIEPGWTLRLLAPLASRICVTHERSAQRYRTGKAVVTGYPLRQGFHDLDKPLARAHFQLNGGPALLVTGAVRGARRINDCIAERLDAWLTHTQLVHISGRDDYDRLARLREALPARLRSRYRLYSYMAEEMPLAMAACDLAVSRAGASVMGEYPAAALPAVLAPLGEAGAHQRYNAQLLADAGGAVLIDDERIDDQLFHLTTSLLGDTQRLESMRESMRRLRRTDAAARIAEVIMAVAK
ncbi:MAG: UDP-N-acetylglucosamine--N-acetylmuramyl-(pentapeptide) pyrophosphoryl-undecaprenol N-acetylglucosamine transferase [Chloroflexi bacterium]|nr:UDP-N-acetylglucosamine--N-acetylmuramyl-(pentapeptide) pyrophosphoryl-undecaprenol N-acetylglucosamine transferase [Chloroflexota bacterium]MYD15586.1 UDP-N-acetylglucosamine--N-acetylmuramyl-(pentapeptide) pyrophosphoryl-undecaprenol N-acetylglucosamine transferase [Chloroflexota bacterium]